MTKPTDTPDGASVNAPMTQEEKRVKIAEACGWFDITDYGSGMYFRSPDGVRHFNGTACLPDYFASLDACHEMEKAFSSVTQTDMYESMLRESVNSAEGEFYNPSDVCIWHATAAQRAEAFGLALGLWKTDV